MPGLARCFDVAVSALLLRSARPSERPKPDLEELANYTCPEFLHEPARLYRFPNTPPPLSWSSRRSLRWGERYAFSFPSPFTPLQPGYAQRYASCTENHTGYGQLYRPLRACRGAVLYLHGWMSASFRLEERILFSRLARETGLAVLALELPFHMTRRPAHSAISGEFFVSADLVRTLEAFRQAVAETRAMLAWLRQETAGPVGLIGFSLGALVNSLLLGSGARPDFAISLLTPADVLRTVEEAPMLSRLREDIFSDGLRREDLEPWAGLLSPMALAPVLPRQRLLFIHGREDSIAPPEGVRALGEAWGRPEIFWYPGGHFSIVLYPRAVLARCRAFLKEVLAEGQGGE